MQRWNRCENVLNVNNVGNLQLKWSYRAGYQVEYSAPAVANGVVYIGSMDGNLYALKAGTGSKRWSYHAGDWVRSSPAVANGVVYFNSNNNLDALNARTGALLWSHSPGGDSSPTVANGVVYVGGGDNVYALEASTGATLWSYTTGSFVSSSPAVANGVVYFGSEDAVRVFLARGGERGGLCRLV
jgi:outer membrane protein assembly factor BamB